MCGIAGLLDLDGQHPPQREALARMSAGLTHRGPDDDGLYLVPPIGLATKRLSIVDVDGGHMPLSNEDGSLWLSHNGEVYNAPTLRDELCGYGHTFRTRGDSEVIVHAYEQWGEDCVARLRGMFAFALWDAKRERLLLARDRFGVKPLYYAQRDGTFAFASEMLPTLSGAGLARAADPSALSELFTYGYVAAPHTVFAGIRSLLPAHLMLVEHGQCKIRPYWQLQFPAQGEQARITHADAQQQFYDLLRKSVRMSLMSDVPIAALLSGGLDSSALVALLQDLSSGRTATFSIGFEADSHDESHFARLAAQHLHTDHQTLSFALRDFAHWPEVIRRMESPQTSATSIPIYMLYRACHESGYKVILTGEGADELLGGYHWFAGDRRVRALLSLPQPLRAQMARLPLGSSAGRRVLAHGSQDDAESYALWSEVTTASERLALKLPSANFPFPACSNPPAARPGSGLHPLDTFLWLEAHTRLPNFINDEVDRMSMAHSVEARVPYLDHRLWEFAATLPPHFKLGGGAEKRLLRAATKGRLPDRIRLRRKQGLAAPHALFWRQPGLPPFARDAMSEGALRETGLFDAGVVRDLLCEHRQGRADHARLLTGVLTTQLWHDIFLA
ncbi:MAG: asparagine synthase (glutamine-hydrolyzing) [Chloroflexi bacterium]|nr:MAG: asparagine synthase (glutamine-hydrolyzing) [Chloroflexota bacterium]